MKKLVLYIIAFSMLAGFSCSNRTPFFEKYFKFENGNWDRFNKINFKIPVQNENAGINITLVLKPTKEFIYQRMPVYIILDTPSGEERMNDLKIQVKEGDKFEGEVEGQPVIIKTSLWKDLHVSGKGSCTLSIENMVPKIQTAGISEIGIIAEYSRK